MSNRIPVGYRSTPHSTSDEGYPIGASSPVEFVDRVSKQQFVDQLKFLIENLSPPESVVASEATSRLAQRAFELLCRAEVSQLLIEGDAFDSLIRGIGRLQWTDPKGRTFIPTIDLCHTAKCVVYHAKLLARRLADETPSATKSSTWGVNSGNTGADSADSPKLFPGGTEGMIQDVIDLAVKLQTERGKGRSKREIAREFTGKTIGNSRKADSLLRQIRRYSKRGRINI